jgi:hypothetical protein
MTVNAWRTPAFPQAFLLPILLLSLPARAADWEAPRLPWGDPDLQGVWTNATITTLERPDGMDELVLSEEQARALERQDAAVFSEIDDLPEGELPAGTVVGGYNTAWLDPGTRLLRVKGEPRTSIIVEPADGQVPYTISGELQFLQAVVRSQKRNNPEEQLLGDRCVVGDGSTGEPPMLPVEYNNNYQIVQTPGQVMILVEMNHAVRTIRIGGAPLPPQIRPWLGDSIGHWEGATLVVETTQFHPQESLRGAIKHQLYVGMDTRVTERFTRVGEKEVHYEFTVEDERSTRSLARRADLEAEQWPDLQYACHEATAENGQHHTGGSAREHGVNGIRWLVGLIAHPPVRNSTTRELSPSAFSAASHSQCFDHLSDLQCQYTAHCQ